MFFFIIITSVSSLNFSLIGVYIYIYIYMCVCVFYVRLVTIKK